MGITTARLSRSPVPTEEHHPVDLPALTGLRAFAAAAVVLHHLGPLTGAFDQPVAVAARRLLEGGMLGVDVFFALSGFVIAHTYAHRLATRTPGARRSYLVARLARVYPLHLITLLAFAAVVLIGGGSALGPDGAAQYTWLAFLGNVVMLQALPGIHPWNYPSWSISCELVAYLVFPLFAARLLRVRWTTALVLAAATLFLELLLIHETDGAAWAVHSAFWARITGGFTAGALLWVVWRRVLRPGWWGDAVVGLCVVSAAWQAWGGHPWRAIALLVALVPAAACATGPVSALLAHPVTQWGGRVSYAFYLTHFLMMVVALRAMPEARPPVSIGGTVVYVVAVVVASLAVAAVLHHGVEEPSRRWLRRRFARTGAQAVRVGPVGAKVHVTRERASR